MTGSSGTSKTQPNSSTKGIAIAWTRLPCRTEKTVPTVSETWPAVSAILSALVQPHPETYCPIHAKKKPVAIAEQQPTTRLLPLACAQWEPEAQHITDMQHSSKKEYFAVAEAQPTRALPLARAQRCPKTQRVTNSKMS